MSEQIQSPELTLTARQQREREEFNARARSQAKSEVDFDHYNHKRFGPWNPYWRLHDLVIRTGSRPGARVLSYGCGDGKAALIYAHAGCTVDGFDISDGLVDVARTLAAKYGLTERATFSAQPAEQLDYPDETFDIAAGISILHHVDISRAVSELYRVLKPGGIAVFKDSIATPWRDRIRRAPPATWILPLNVKNRRTGEMYQDTEDERPLNGDDLALIRQRFPKMRVERFHVLTLLAKIFGNRPFFERWDWRMFKVLPFLRRFGDHVVIVLEK